MRIWESYLQSLDSNPIRTKALTSGALSALSDILAQILQNRLGKSGDAELKIRIRNSVFQALVGIFYRAPVIHFWFEALDRIIFRSWTNSGWSTVLAKIFVNQTCFTPVFVSVYLMIYAKFMQNRSIREAFKSDLRWKGKLGGILRANWKIWPIVGLISFRFVPPKLRVLFGNVVAIFWTIYIILISGNASSKEEEKVAKVQDKED